MLLLLLLALSPDPGVPVLEATLDPQEEFCVECCSLYCGASPTLSVSAHVAPQSENHYDAAVLADGKLDTAWVVSGGASHWFQFTFEPSGLHPGFPKNNKRTGVNSLHLSNGYNKSPSRWREHARIRQLLVAVDGRDEARIILLDDSRPQRVDLPPTLIRPGMAFRFTVEDTYPGDRLDETALSEVRLDGYGVH